MTLPLIIIITHQCNLNCRYCLSLKKREFIKKEIAFQAIDLYFSSLADGSGKIKIFGGEPLLKINLLKKIIKYIRKQNSGIAIELTTNGTLLEHDIIGWLKNYKVNLSISIDGDEKSQLLNKTGISSAIYQKTISLVKKASLGMIINMVIAPNNVDSFFQNFIYLYNLNVRKFNFLPASYLPWSKRELKLLENQFNLISFFIHNHPEIYVKNIDINNDLLLFNLGIVVDCNGDIFFTDAVMAKRLQKIKKNFKIGNIKSLNSLKPLLRLNTQQQKEKIESFIKNLFKQKALKANQAIDSSLNNFVESLKLSVKKDVRVDIKIGYQCNNRCFFCVQGNKREKCSFVDESKIKKDLIKARKTCQSVVFTGGEPTIHPNFLDLVRLARELNFKIIQIQTNGRMFAYKDFCRETIKAGANEFSPALHGHTADLHDYLTNISGSFNQTSQGIKNLKVLGQKVITNTVITKFNYRYLPEIARFLVYLNVDQFQFAFIHIVGAAWEKRNSIVPRKSLTIPYVKKGLDIGIAAGKKVMVEAMPYCLMKDYERYVAEQVIPDSIVIENKLVIKDYKKYRVNSGKTKDPNCVNCIYFSICEGPWREYPEIFGWDEFKPVLKT